MKSDDLASIDKAISEVVEYIDSHLEEGINFMVMSDHTMMDIQGLVTADTNFYTLVFNIIEAAKRKYFR